MTDFTDVGKLFHDVKYMAWDWYKGHLLIPTAVWKTLNSNDDYMNIENITKSRNVHVVFTDNNFNNAFSSMMEDADKAGLKVINTLNSSMHPKAAEQFADGFMNSVSRMIKEERYLDEVIFTNNFFLIDGLDAYSHKYDIFEKVHYYIVKEFPIGHGSTKYKVREITHNTEDLYEVFAEVANNFDNVRCEAYDAKEREWNEY